MITVSCNTYIKKRYKQNMQGICKEEIEVCNKYIINFYPFLMFLYFVYNDFYISVTAYLCYF